MAQRLKILFVGADESAFRDATDRLRADGHEVQCVASVFKALAAHAAMSPDLTVVDASRLDDQMLEVFEALKDAAPNNLLLAAVTSASRGRAAKVLNLGSDAIVGLPTDPDEIRALVRKLRAPAPAPPSPAPPGPVGPPEPKAATDEKFKWLSEFAAGVAHNINNPMTTVIGYLQILRSQVQATSQTGSMLAIMLKECERISEIVRNLLLFSGNANLEPQPVDVNRAVDAALLLAGAAEQNENIRVERSYQPGLPSILADEEALKLACESIAVNARQAMRNGGTLSVETMQNGSGKVLIRFRDTGPGIPAEKTDKLFEPFYTGKNNGAVGLGLAASYGIVKGFGGTIKVQSQEGAGATFTIELPVGA